MKPRPPALRLDELRVQPDDGGEIGDRLVGLTFRRVGDAPAIVRLDEPGLDSSAAE